MKKCIYIVIALLLTQTAYGNYKIILTNDKLDIPKKINTSETCKDLDSGKLSGFYKFNINGQDYTTYCYNNNGEFWTLIGHFNYLVNFQQVENLTTLNTEGYLPINIWNSIKNNMNDMIFAPVNANANNAGKLSLNTLTSGNCYAFDYFSTLGDRMRIFHNEDIGCTGSGSDYTTIELKHPYEENTVGFWNFSTTANIEEIGNFFSGTTVYQNVENYSNVYFFVK